MLNKKGVTLMELLIYIAILAVLMVVVVTIFLSVTRGQGQSQARSEVNSNLRFIVEKIQGDMRAASSTQISSPASTSTTSSTLTFVVGASTISYSTTTAMQMQRIVDGAAQNISSDAVQIDTLTFRRIENSNSVLNKTFVSIEATIAASYKSTGPALRYSETIRTTISTR